MKQKNSTGFLIHMQSVKTHQRHGHQAGGDQLDGDAPEGAGTALQVHLGLEAGKAGQGQRDAHAAEEGEEKGGEKAVAALSDEQSRAQSGTVGGDGGQILIHPSGQLGDAGAEKAAQPLYQTGNQQGEGQKAEVLEIKPP